MFKKNKHNYTATDRLFQFENELISEFLFQIKHQLNSGCRVVYLDCSSKHDFFLNDQELHYLGTCYVRTHETLNYIFSENIKNIKYSQRCDLFFLTSLQNLDLLILLPKLDENNKYYFNMLLVVKKEFNVDQINN